VNDKPMSQQETARKTGRKKGLNPKQQRFVNEYLIDRNGTQAAIRAGYSKHTAGNIAGNLFKKIEIREAVAKGEEEIAKGTQLSRDYVINGLLANAERAMQYRKVLDKDGKPTGEFKYDGQVANRAYELLGKAINMFAETRRIEFDEATLNAILAGLPSGFGEAVRAELSRIISEKRG
jgi:phage terminase small subunit